MQAHSLQVLPESADLVSQQPLVHLDLLLAHTLYLPAARLALQVRPHARQPRQLVLRHRQLHLQLALRRASALGEDVQDEVGAVADVDALPQQTLEVAALRWSELVVKDHRVHVVCGDEGGNLLHLARADEGARVGRLHSLGRAAHHPQPGRVRQLGQLSQRLLHPEGGGAASCEFLFGGALEIRPNEVRCFAALLLRPGGGGEGAVAARRGGEGCLSLAHGVPLRLELAQIKVQ
mmetsp:Transcript_45027/g.86072  ORF Transcript_45027/g.86072 Transcript_45027/m.86072 type:complete len:235 (+) Transcript_45027:1203-1907(+)